MQSKMKNLVVACSKSYETYMCSVKKNWTKHNVYSVEELGQRGTQTFYIESWVYKRQERKIERRFQEWKKHARPTQKLHLATDNFQLLHVFFCSPLLLLLKCKMRGLPFTLFSFQMKEKTNATLIYNIIYINIHIKRCIKTI